MKLRSAIQKVVVMIAAILIFRDTSSASINVTGSGEEPGGQTQEQRERVLLMPLLTQPREVTGLTAGQRKALKNLLKRSIKREQMFASDDTEGGDK